MQTVNENDFFVFYQNVFFF